MDHNTLLKRFAKGGTPLSNEEMDALCCWAESQPPTDDDIVLLQHIARSRKYHTGLNHFKHDYHKHTYHPYRRVWAVAASVLLLIGIGLLVRPSTDPVSEPMVAMVTETPTPLSLPDDSHAYPSPSHSRDVARSVSTASGVCTTSRDARPCVSTPCRNSKAYTAVTVPEEMAAETTPPMPVTVALAEVETPPATETDILMAETAPPARILIETKGLVAYNSKSREIDDTPLKDIYGNPVREDTPLLAMAL